MILIGQYDSPFVRRVGITLKTYGMAFEHRPWSTFGNADQLAKVNPLIRVPTLMLDDDNVLIETASIIDYLDSCVAPDKRLYPQSQPARRTVMQTVALASGISDKAVSLFYEQRLHETPSAVYVSRLTRQIEGALQALKNHVWQGGQMTQSDIAITCMWRHLREAHPAITPQRRFMELEKHSAHFEALPLFKEISQPFIAPAE
jgi:glutathione S-transferase